jgi:hypothetical protein
VQLPQHLQSFGQDLDRFSRHGDFRCAPTLWIISNVLVLVMLRWLPLVLPGAVGMFVAMFMALLHGMTPKDAQRSSAVGWAAYRVCPRDTV